MMSETRSGSIVFREHRIPTQASRPYILACDAHDDLWLCESGAGKIARLSLDDLRFTEFEIPTPDCRPIGIALGADGHLWFTENAGHKVGRITRSGEITEFALPTPNAGPDGIGLGPDGNIWFAEKEAGKVARITPAGVVTEYAIFPEDARPLAPVTVGETIWWSDPPGNRIFRMTLDGGLAAFPTGRPRGGPRAMCPASDGNLWYVLAEANAIGRMDLHGRGAVAFPLPRPESSPRSIVEADGEIWFTDAGTNTLGRMSLAGELLAEYPVPTPESGLRAMKLHPDGRIFFSEHDAGQIGEAVR